MVRGSSGLPIKKWDAEAREELCRIIIQMYVEKIDYKEVAAKMGDIMAKSVEHRFFKIKGATKEKALSGNKVKKGVKNGANMSKITDMKMNVDSKKMKAEI